MLADEPRDAAPVPERPSRQETAIRLALPLVAHPRGRDVPALPASLRGAVAEVDVLAVEAEAGVEAAQLVEHRAAQQDEAAEEPVRLRGLRRILAEVIVRALARERRQQTAQRRPADEG